ncbi:MAG: FAD:protein FMN transferase [Candidatus Omnitrophica bacterium]|nr:FAD:protein FMN transferase [Candidatus Omnitrophota bacterium]
MDTFAEISCYNPDKEKAVASMDRAFEEMRRVERLCSKFDDKSELFKINNLAGKEKAKVSPEMFSLIGRSIDYSVITDGAFDITAEIGKKGRYKKISLDKENYTVYFLEEDIKIDLGGIAKGYAVDKAKDILLADGIIDVLVNIGGNIFAAGNPPDRDNWRIGIRDPENKNNIIDRIELKDQAVATSGNYERPSHVIDPASGASVTSGGSVTIVAGSAEKADVLSTAVFVKGPEGINAILKAFKDIKIIESSTKAPEK